MRLKRWMQWGLLFGAVVGVYGQTKPLLYDFTELPQAMLQNPGTDSPIRWHVGVPLLSSFSFQAGISGFSAADLFANDGVDFTTKVGNLVRDELNQRDRIALEGQMELISVGFQKKLDPSIYYSFGIYGDFQFINYWPSDLSRLAFDGNAGALNRRFDLEDLKIRADGVIVFHAGISKKISRRWRVGARAKVYSSIFQLQSTKNKGYFVTTEGQNNLLRNTLVADMQVQTSGLQEIRSIFQDGVVSNNAQRLQQLLLRRALLGGDLGIGADFGFTFFKTPEWRWTGSVTDLGFIYHNKDILNYTLNGAVSNEGVQFILPDVLLTPGDPWQNLIDEIDQLIPFEENKSAYISMRPVRVNLQVRRNWGQPRDKVNPENCYCGAESFNNGGDFGYLNSYGALLNWVHRPRGLQWSLSGFYQRRIGSAWTLKTTLGVDQFQWLNLGLGTQVQAGPIQFYLLADNILGYRNIATSHSAYIQFGLNVLAWKPKR